MASDIPQPIQEMTAPTGERPIITCSFSGYEPPRDVARMVQRMLDTVPENYLRGLGEVVLTNTVALTRSRRRQATKSRGKKVRSIDARGLYHHAFHNSPAWIEIFVDVTLRRCSKGLWRHIPWLRDTELGEVLFHELGHHIHFTARPENREREDVADVWKVRLQRNYNQIRHPWIRRVAHAVGPLSRLVNKAHAQAHASMLKKGYISRAEYEESVNPREHYAKSFK